ncbi:MAG TPA: MATE family efflux transporter [Lachnospiraceae bacterium]|nr:MATE family efflux transporter [Lachnospiraceae bacterium]
MSKEKNDSKKRIYLLKEEKVPKALLKLGIPTMLGMITSAFYNLADTFFVSRLGTAQVGAVSLLYPLGVVLLGIGLLFGTGASSFLARLLGDKKYEEASNCASTALFTSVTVGTLTIMIMLLCMNPILRALGATNTILPYAREYAYIFVGGLVFNVFNITMNNIITAEGAAMYSMKTMLLGGILNLILDPIFIYTFDMGVAGAAIATVISQGISTLFYLNYILGRKSIFHFSVKRFTLSREIFVEIFKVGLPMLLFQLLASTTVSITNILASGYGDSAVAAFGVVTRIMSLGSMAVFGFIKGYQPFVGFNYGAGNMERVESATNTALKWTTLFCTTIGILLIVFSTPLMEVFCKEDSLVVSIGRKTIIANAIAFITLGYQIVFGTMFLALGKAKQGGIISIARQGAFFIPIVFLFTTLFHLNGLVMAQPIADACSVALVYTLRTKDRKKIGLNILQ